MEQINRAKSEGRKLNLCPCGCDEDDLNEHGYCDHLVGFTTDGVTMEPRITDPKKLSRGCRERVGGVVRTHGVDVPLTEPVGEDDILVPITETQRVYRGKRVIRAQPASDVAALENQLAKAVARIEYLEAAATTPASN